MLVAPPHTSLYKFWTGHVSDGCYKKSTKKGTLSFWFWFLRCGIHLVLCFEHVSKPRSCTMMRLPQWIVASPGRDVQLAWWKANCK